MINFYGRKKHFDFDFDEDNVDAFVSLNIKACHVGSDKNSSNGECRKERKIKTITYYSTYIPKEIKKHLTLKEKADLL